MCLWATLLGACSHQFPHAGCMGSFLETDRPRESEREAPLNVVNTEVSIDAPRPSERRWTQSTSSALDKSARALVYYGLSCVRLPHRNEGTSRPVLAPGELNAPNQPVEDVNLL